jgi:DNA polymerase-3 subunit alpha
LEKAQNFKRLQEVKQMSMFETLGETFTDDWLPETAPWEESVKLAHEKEALGLYLTGHPLDGHRNILRAWLRTSTADLAETPDGEDVALGVVVTSLKEKAGKKGGRLAIVTVEDLAGSVEALVFGELYDRAKGWLAQPSLPLWLKATVVQEDKGPKLVVQEIAPLGSVLPKWPDRLDLRLQAATVSRDELLALKDILSRHTGPVPAFLHFLSPAGNGGVLALPENLALTPSEALAGEVNRLFGYSVLTI